MLPPLLRLLSVNHDRLAKDAGVSPVTLSRILRGHSIPAEKTLRALENALLSKLRAEVE